MRRNGRSALWALGLAGATWLWRNRQQLQQQLNQGRNRFGSSSPRQLPDWNGNEQTAPDQNGTSNPRSRTSFGGTEV